MFPTGPDRGEPKGEGPARPSMLRALLIMLAVWLLVIWVISPVISPEPPIAELSYSEFLTEVQTENVTTVTITGDTITGELAEPTTFTEDFGQVEAFRTMFPEAVGDPDLLPLLASYDVDVQVESDEPSAFWSLIIGALPWILLIAFFIWIMRRSGGPQQQVMAFGKSKARRAPERPDTTFDDVAGQEEAKQELRQVVGFLRNPRSFRAIGARLPRGVLLVGPPGTGKTLLARAVAGEAGVPFYNLSATEFVEMFVGVGASRVRDLFEKAKADSPSIIFLDELDAVGRRRGAGVGTVNDEREQTLNQLLYEMDGFDERQDVIVLSATNRPDILDPALLRPGRFDREVVVGLPDREDRAAILRVHTREIPIADDVDLDAVAAATMGMSGADLANIANEAALFAGARHHGTVTAADFDAAMDKLMLGGERKLPIEEEERRAVAYHEAGHAITAWFTVDADPVRKVTIVPHGRALGATSQLPEEDRVNYTRRFLIARLTVLLAGRAAEELVLEDVTTGAEADLIEATRLARRMVTRWGMGSLGPIAFRTDDEQPFLGYELSQPREVSPETATRIDKDVERLVGEAHEAARLALTAHRGDLETVVAALLTEETLDDGRIEALVGPPLRQFAPPGPTDLTAHPEPA